MRGLVLAVLLAASPALAQDCATLDADLAAALETRITAAGDRLNAAEAMYVDRTNIFRNLMAQALAGQADFADVDTAETSADLAREAAFAALREYDRLTALRDDPTGRAADLNRADDWAACAD